MIEWINAEKKAERGRRENGRKESDHTSETQTFPDEHQFREHKVLFLSLKDLFRDSQRFPCFQTEEIPTEKAHVQSIKHIFFF